MDYRSKSPHAFRVCTAYTTQLNAEQCVSCRAMYMHACVPEPAVVGASPMPIPSELRPNWPIQHPGGVAVGRHAHWQLAHHSAYGEYDGRFSVSKQEACGQGVGCEQHSRTMFMLSSYMHWTDTLPAYNAQLLNHTSGSTCLASCTVIKPCSSQSRGLSGTRNPVAYGLATPQHSTADNPTLIALTCCQNRR